VQKKKKKQEKEQIDAFYEVYFSVNYMELIENVCRRKKKQEKEQIDAFDEVGQDCTE
jgi:hypothetical protein